MTFTVARYEDDGRNKPYRLKFKQNGARSLYMFDSTSHVTNIKVGTVRFEVRYCSYFFRTASLFCGLKPLVFSGGKRFGFSRRITRMHVEAEKYSHIPPRKHAMVSSNLNTSNAFVDKSTGCIHYLI